MIGNVRSLSVKECYFAQAAQNGGGETPASGWQAVGRSRRIDSAAGRGYMLMFAFFTCKHCTFL